jgi:hypothetical protein
MSQHETVELTCAACAARFPALVATSLNAVRAPAARVTALDGTLHRFDCPTCGAAHRVDTDFGYLDAGRRHWLAVCPAAAIDHWPAREAAARDAFWSMTDRAPSMWVYQAVAMKVRCVFGPEGLTEKLTLWEAGLDDAVVEMWKQELLADQPSLRGRWIRVESVQPDAVIFAAGDARFEGHRARYQVLLATRDGLRRRATALFEGPFVDARRLATASPPA